MLKVHWFLPTGGDSRDVLPEGDNVHWRPPSHEYLAQIAIACDQLGFEAMLTPCGTGCEDAWLATASLIPLTGRIKFLVAFRPGFLSPTLAAQMASTFQGMSNGRLLINIVTGAEPRELNRFGDWLDKDSRYERTGEFLDIMGKACSDEPDDFEGTYYKIAGATTREVPEPVPPIYFGGASPAVAAGHIDVYLTWGEPPDMAAQRIDKIRERKPKPTSPPRCSEGQRRMAQLHGGSRDDLEIHPNVWAGIGLVRGGAGTALVGSYEEVADRIAEYADVGFEEFILSGYPHLEEAFWFGEGVMPVLRERGMVEPLAARKANVFSFR